MTAAFQLSANEIELNKEEEDLVSSIGTDFTILVVEDTADMRQFICKLLEKQYTVLSATNGMEGLELLRQADQNIHLVVSDIMMPEMDGFELLKEIKSNDAFNNIPVVMLTALAGERDKLTALTIGVDDYLTKPFSVSELLTRVQNLLYNYHNRQLWQSQSNTSSDQETEKAPMPSASKIIASNVMTLQDKKWVENAKQMVEASLSESLIKTEELANQQHLSLRQFNRKLNRLIGLSAGRFIREVQLEAARKILEDGQALSVSEVAYRCGFDYPTTFSSLFKKRYGKSPVAFLKGVAK